ncbi:MAG: phage holin family protein [Patescibacteria group bacterium]
MQLLLRWLLNTLALMVVANIVPGIHIDTFYHALIAALILGLANALVRPILIILTLPVTILTLGLFIFVINALMILFASSIVKGFTVTGFVPAFLAAIVFWFMSMVTNWFIQSTEK